MGNSRQPFNRRVFLQRAGASGLALVIGTCWPLKGNSHGEIRVMGGTGDEAGTELMSWISIDPAGKVTIFNHRSEMGQGTWQAIPQIIAEELEVDMNEVEVRPVAANPKKYGPQPQEGSFSVRGWYLDLLRAGATARQMLITAAANKWGVAAGECFAENGKVINRKTGQFLPYGALVNDAVKLVPPTDVKLKERKDYKQIGKPLKRRDTPFKTNGSAVFGLDKKLPGMLYAVVERSPRIKGKVKTFDDSMARAVPGVKHVFTVQRAVFGALLEGVAVVADTLWAAMQARKLLKVTWDDGGFEHLGSDELTARMHDGLYKPPPSPEFDAALAQAKQIAEAVYEMPYQSHSCMEPLNCTADVREDSIEIWGPIQEANWIQADLSQRMGIPVKNITVNMTFLGGGFGRKAFTDYPHEAALISKQIKAPVQVVWTREDDLSMGPFRSGAAYRCRGGVDGNGNILALQVVTASQAMDEASVQEVAPGPLSVGKGQIGGLAQPYYKTIPHYSLGYISINSPIPTMWWRAPGANVDGFACESFIDELAHLAGKDPLAFRRAHLNTPRYQALVDKLAAVSNWHNRGKNAGWGAAITESFGSTVGQVVKVSKAGGRVTIDKVFAVMDCGWYVNPDIICAQVQGSIIMGLGAAVCHATHFNNGMAVEQNFSTYNMPRIYDIPDIEVHVMENNELPGGVGEPGLPPFAPALCNAIYDLTGKRIRKLPFNLADV